MDKLSYAWGLAMGNQLKAMGVKDLDAESYANAVKSVFDGTTPEMSPEEAQKTIQDFLTELEAKMTEAAKAEGNAFLKENAAKEGVKVTASGLQYRVEKEGEGECPGPEDEVTVHYTGRLLIDTVFPLSRTTASSRAGQRVCSS